jgi:hypothetical protein
MITFCHPVKRIKDLPLNANRGDIRLNLANYCMYLFDKKWKNIGKAETFLFYYNYLIKE